jgi:hypothetical protein
LEFGMIRMKKAIVADLLRNILQFVNIALGSAGENYSQMYALLRAGEIPQITSHQTACS